MELDTESLSLPEKVALVVLVKALVVADKAVSREEALELAEVARQVGSDVMKRADGVKLTGEDSLRSFLGTVQRQEAREILYDALLAIAKADSIAAAETRILDMVAEAWDIVTLESHAPKA